MRRTAALTVTFALLLTGCGSSDDAAPAPSSSAPATSGADDAGSSSAAPSSTGNVTVTPELAGWASAFCTAATPLTTLGTLPNPDTSTPETTKTSLASFYSQGAAVFTEAAASLAQVGPPPVDGDAQLTQGAVDALNASATQFQGLASAATAADPADATAIGGLVSGFSDAIAALQASFATLNQGEDPLVGAAIAAAPECSALAG